MSPHPRTATPGAPGLGGGRAGCWRQEGSGREGTCAPTDPSPQAVLPGAGARPLRAAVTIPRVPRGGGSSGSSVTLICLQRWGGLLQLCLKHR